MDKREVLELLDELQKRSPEFRQISVKENVSIAVSILAVLANIGMLFYFGGRIEQRVTNVEAGLLETRSDVKTSGATNAAQDVSIASQEAKYGEINRQLSRLEIAVSGRRQ